MKNESPQNAQTRPSLDQRFAQRPHVYHRLHRIADMMDQAIAEGATADEAEAMAIQELQKLGGDVLTDWSQAKEAQSVAQAQAEHPEAIRHIKKKVSWLTTYGRITVEEQLLRLGRRGRELRPFCVPAGVRPRGYSRRLQQALVDFGAEGAFGPAARRVREHYGIEVPESGVRRWTLQHGQAMAAMADKTKPKKAAKIGVTEMDGSMVPVVQPGTGKDRGQGKTLLWREARLCCARAAESVTPVYGATLGGVGAASLLWRQTAALAGVQSQTYVHGVGDGAAWIVDQFTENNGSQGAYLIDFYHVSEYLAAAAFTVAPGQERTWRRRQQGRLFNNRIGSILRSLEKHLEPLGAKEHPVRKADQYLRQRLDHLDYAQALGHKLPIGSGEIESGRRHVIQRRLKLSGAWWTERNLESMLQLRVARANNWWDAYWQSAAN